MVRRFFILLSLALSTLAHAHSYHAVRTQVQFNQESGVVEIIHRAFVADLSSVMSKELGKPYELTTRDEAWVQSYWDNYFGFLGEAEQALPISWVGMELDHHDLWVYQEYHGDIARLKASRLHNGLLFGQFEHQVNTVDVKLGEDKTALIFTEQKSQQPLLAKPSQHSHHH